MNSLLPWQKTLAERARHAMLQAYAPYSRFRVGAALMLDDGNIVEGCNVENCSYGLTICAERTAAVTAIARGERRWQAMAIATEGGVSPCGACRQFLAEFAPDLTLLLVDNLDQRPVEIISLAVLLPRCFTPDRLEKT